MSPGRGSDLAAEKGFGTGLRAQLARNKKGELDAEPVQLSAAAGEALVSIEQMGLAPDAVGALRNELEASLAREQELRDLLSIRREADRERRELRTGELEQRARQLEATEIAFAERERSLATESARIEQERARLEKVEAELTLAKARADEL
ncbi:MAG: hypothetical protein ACXVZP_03945, partial [Gaiellaceae bacterium]